MQRVTVGQFWERINRDGPLPEHRPELGPCWLWIGPQAGGQFGNRYGSFGNEYAHRYAYRLLVGPIPDGFEVDHRCRRRLCVRPTHLSATTLAENRPKKTHCKRGHPYDEANTYWHNGHKFCRACKKLSQKTKRRERRGGIIKPLPGERTHCPAGHPYDEANTYHYKGRRLCRACRLQQHAAYMQRRRAT